MTRVFLAVALAVLLTGCLTILSVKTRSLECGDGERIEQSEAYYLNLDKDFCTPRNMIKKALPVK